MAKHFNLTFYVNAVSPHTDALLFALAGDPSVDSVRLFSEGAVEAERVALGWPSSIATKYQHVSSPNPGVVRDYILNGPEDAIHIFFGMRHLKCVKEGLATCLAAGRRFGIVQEPRVREGLLGALRLLQSWVTEVRLRRQVSFVLAIGQHGPTWFKLAGYRKELIFPFAYFISEAPKRTDVTPSGSALRVAYVGRLVAEKGVGDILSCLPFIKTPFELQIIGKGPLERECGEVARRDRRVRLVGNIPMESVQPRLRHIDLLVQPSRTTDDGWGVVVSEALLSGAAVIASKAVGASMCLSSPARGLIVPTHSPAKIAGAIDQLSSSNINTEKARQARIDWARASLTAGVGSNYLINVLRHVAGHRERPRSFLAPDDGSFRSEPLACVAIQQQVLPHYRGGLFDKLSRSSMIDYSFFASSEPTDGIASMNYDILRQFHKSPVRRILGTSFFWQNAGVSLGLSRRFNVIIFMGNPYYLSTWVGAALARARGIGVIFWAHGWLREERGLKKLLRKQFYKLASRLLVYSERSKALGISAGYPSERVSVVYNGLDLDAAEDTFREVRDGLLEHRNPRRLFDNPDLPLVVCSARLTNACRIDVLIEAASLLARRGIIINVCLVGDGPERSRLEAQAITHKINVRFLGACYDGRILGPMFYHADITVSPGKIGLTAIHSLMFGTPAITHSNLDKQMPEVEVITPGLTGELFKQGDSEDLATQIVKVLGRSERRDAVRCACRAVIHDKWNDRMQALLIEKAILEMLDQNSA